MDESTRHRLNRIINGLGWLLDDGPIDIDGRDRDVLSAVRFQIEEAVDHEVE